MRVSIGCAALLAVTSVSHAEATALGSDKPMILCHGYDEATSSCQMIQRLEPLETGAISFKETYTIDAKEDGIYSLSMKTEVEPKDGKLCFKSPNIRYDLDPVDSKVGNFVAAKMEQGFRSGVSQGYCIEHTECDGRYIATISIGGVKRQSERTILTAFASDEPIAADLKTRPTRRSDLSEMRRAIRKCRAPWWAL